MDFAVPFLEEEEVGGFDSTTAIRDLGPCQGLSRARSEEENGR